MVACVPIHISRQRNALGIALTVATAVFLMSLVAGLDRAFASTGDPHNVVVLRKGSDAELTGGFPLGTLQTLRSLAGDSSTSRPTA